MGDEKKEGGDKSVEEDQKSEDGKQHMDEMGEKEKDEDVVDVEQHRRELELLHEQKEKLKEEFEKDDQRLTQLTREKENVDRMAVEAKETTDDLLKSYEKQEEIQQSIVDDQSTRTIVKEDLSEKIKSIQVAQGRNSPALEELEDKLKNLEEEDARDKERNDIIHDKKTELERLLVDHAVSISEVEARKKAIDEEIAKISARMNTRELEEQKLLERIAVLKARVPEQRNEIQKPEEKEVPKEGITLSYQSLQSSSSIVQLREQKEKAVNVAKAIRALKEDISDILMRDHLTEEDIKGLPMKQNVIMFRLAELDQITRRIQDLMGLTVLPSSEISLPSKHKFQPDFVRPSVGMLSQIRPEDTLPQVVVCGTDGSYPQIVVCEVPKFRNFQERIVRNGNFNTGNNPGQQQRSNPRASADVYDLARLGNEQHQQQRFNPRASADVFDLARLGNGQRQQQRSNPRASADVYDLARLGDGQRMDASAPYYGARMEALGMLGPFGQSNMPIAGWMITPGIGYTIRPPVAVQGPMMMPQQMFHPGMSQTASVGSFIPCPCICPKKRRKRNTVIPQVYSCPNVKRQSLRCNRSY